MSPNISIGKKIAAARVAMNPPLSKKDLLRKLEASGVVMSHAELEALEEGKHSLTYYQITVLASVLNTTSRDLMVS